MRQSITIIALFFCVACKYTKDENRTPNKIKATAKQAKAIGLVRLGDYNLKNTEYLQKEIANYYARPVRIINLPNINPNYINREKGIRYSADSIIHFLASLKTDSIELFLGLTSADIFTTVREKDGSIKKPIDKYKVWGIFGLGFQPGNACVVSDKRLQIADIQKFNHRVRTVCLHEVGHNLGLPHCPNEGCIMSDANEKISTVDNSNNDICVSCKKRIGLN